MPGVELRLRAPDGSLAPWDGEATGELEARGPWVASAYFEPDGDANATRFTADGWFRTGDVARIGRDGAVEIVDREKDLVKSGGEWISSAELERAIVEHPAVREVVVIAVPDEEWGERPAALVVPEGDAAPGADELREWLAGRVARWWIPAVWETVAGAAEDRRRQVRQARAAGALRGGAAGVVDRSRRRRRSCSSASIRRATSDSAVVKAARSRASSTSSISSSNASIARSHCAQQPSARRRSARFCAPRRGRATACATTSPRCSRLAITALIDCGVT